MALTGAVFNSLLNIYIYVCVCVNDQEKFKVQLKKVRLNIISYLYKLDVYLKGKKGMLLLGVYIFSDDNSDIGQ